MNPSRYDMPGSSAVAGTMVRVQETNSGGEVSRRAQDTGSKKRQKKSAKGRGQR